MLSASNENIKVWNIERGALLDVIQVPQKGFCDFRVSEVSNYFLSAFLNTTSFSMYGIPYDNINTSEEEGTQMDIDHYGALGGSASPPSDIYNEHIPTKDMKEGGKPPSGSAMRDSPTKPQVS